MELFESDLSMFQESEQSEESGDGADNADDAMAQTMTCFASLLAMAVLIGAYHWIRIF